MGVGLIVWCMYVFVRIVNPSIVRHCGRPLLTLWLLDGIIFFVGGEILIHYACTSLSSMRLGCGPPQPLEVEVGEPQGEEEEATAVLAAYPPHIRGTRKRKIWDRFVSQWSCGPQLQECSAASLAGIEEYMEWVDHLSDRERRFLVLDAPRRFCEVCRRFKAPREHHCSVCQACVPKMDHHCVWVNNCVDVLNQRFFTSLLIWISIGSVLGVTIGLSACVLEWKGSGDGGGITLIRCKAVRVMLFITLFFVGMMLFMLPAVARTVISNTTSVELAVLGMKRSLFASTSFQLTNPYQLSAMHNILEVYARPHYPGSPGSTSYTRRAAASLLRCLISPNRVPTPSHITGTFRAFQQQAALLSTASSNPWSLREKACCTLFLCWLVAVPIFDDGQTYDGLRYPLGFSSRHP